MMTGQTYHLGSVDYRGTRYHRLEFVDAIAHEVVGLVKQERNGRPIAQGHLRSFVRDIQYSGCTPQVEIIQTITDRAWALLTHDVKA